MSISRDLLHVGLHCYAPAEGEVGWYPKDFTVSSINEEDINLRDNNNMFVSESFPISDNYSLKYEDCYTKCIALNDCRDAFDMHCKLHRIMPDKRVSEKALLMRMYFCDTDKELNAILSTL